MKKVKVLRDKNDSKAYCLRCGCLDVKVLSDGTILCKNKLCLALTKYDWETNNVIIKERD